MNSFSKILNRLTAKSQYVFDKNTPISKYVPVDLSISNKKLKEFDVSSSSSLSKFINNEISKQDGLIGYGGYVEIRNIYQRSAHFNKLNSKDERNIHIGIDLWAPEESTIYTPLDGTVHSFKNNTNYGDYGPTIILKHEYDSNVFYTLYGHLSLKSIEELQIGKVFKAGEIIATLGDASVNGDYPPHLHFQIIKDIQGFEGDYPGVCSKNQLDFYLNNCPNPNLILKLEL
jgi:murein DD-endopeptidase MepM/ murein hydrolase activator NlpD